MFISGFQQPRQGTPSQNHRGRPEARFHFIHMRLCHIYFSAHRKTTRGQTLLPLQTFREEPPSATRPVRHSRGTSPVITQPHPQLSSRRRSTGWRAPAAPPGQAAKRGDTASSSRSEQVQQTRFEKAERMQRECRENAGREGGREG